ncbi:MAG: M56 family metallopeptidase [Steroidobacteraceae bacterium]
MLFVLANHLWQSTLVLGIAGLLTLLLRRNTAKLRYALWLGASVKFLVPFAWLAALSANIPWRPRTAAAPQLILLFDRVTTPLASSHAAAARAATTGTSLVPDSVASMVLIALWGCGTFAVVTYWLLRWRRIQRVRRASKPAALEFEVPVRCSKMLFEPGVVGLVRPVLVVPEGIEARLTREQLRAVLAHELCHVRRRDNLTATFHMVVEALFWFYPLVWWLGARLVDERERACDEEVLSTGNSPVAYAEGILQICQHYLESPLICAAGVGGANLKRRIEAIMNNQVTSRLSGVKKLILAAAAFAALAAPIVVGITNSTAARADSSEPPLASSINELRKPPPDPDRNPSRSLRQRFEALLKERYPVLLREKVKGTPVVNVLFRRDGTVDRTDLLNGPPKDFTNGYFAKRLGLATEEVAYVGVLQVISPVTGDTILIAFTERKKPNESYVSGLFPIPDTRAIDRAIAERYFAETLKRGVPAQERLWVLLDSDGRVVRTGQDSPIGSQLNLALESRFPGIETQYVTATAVTDNNLHPVNDLSGKPLQLYCVWLKKGSSLPGST